MPLFRPGESPGYKIHRVLVRLSRDRWLSPAEVQDVSWAVCRRYSGNPHSSHARAVDIACYAIGMLKGRPPAATWEHGYTKLVRDLEKCKPGDRAKAELVILNHTIRREIHDAKRRENLWGRQTLGA